VRKRRNRALSELAAAKNLEFRRRMVGRTLSAVTLNEPGTALTGNFLKLELPTWPAPNLMLDCRIDGVTGAGLAGWWEPPGHGRPDAPAGLEVYPT
jgi:hypothetical protein